jgi:hypothetical protein
MLRRTIGLAAVALAGCSLLVSTSGLDGPSPIDAGSSSDAGTAEASALDGSVDGGVDAGSDSGAIPAGAVLWPTNNHHYLAVKGTITWTAANEAARTLGGHLATITSAEENAFAFALVEAASGAWLGATKVDPSQMPFTSGWTWVTGEPWAYTNWRPGQPDNATGNQDVAHFSAVSADSKWGDDPHDSTADAYIVELEY